MSQYIGYCHLYCSQHGAECPGGHDSPLTATKVGDKVKAGQKFLRSGNSGSATTGAHLHATLSTTLKGVFGVTSQKQDLKKAIKANGWVMPFPESAITGEFGTLSAYRKAKGMQPHSGTDWGIKANTLIPSITAGEVALIQYSKILGWVVVVKVEDSKPVKVQVQKNNEQAQIVYACPHCKKELK